MSTTDEIMALAGAFADAEDADFALHTLDELRAAVAALVAERDLAIHEQDTAQESLRRHQMWLQEAQAERDALRAEVQRMSGITHLEQINDGLIAENAALRRGLIQALDFAATVGGSSSWWEEVWPDYDKAIDAARYGMKEQK